MATVLLAGGLVASSVAAFFACYGFLLGRRSRSWRGLYLEAAGSGGYLDSREVTLEAKGFSGRLISYMAEKSLMTPPQSSLRFPLWRVGMQDIDLVLRQAGLTGLVSREGIVSSRMRMSIGFALVGFLVGFVFSEILSLSLCLLGFVAGFIAPLHALKKEREARTNSVESDLARMLEVVVLGLRGGLSFDRSLGYFCEFFDCGLARSCSLARTQWSHGLLTREEALKSMADSYDSKLVKRAVSVINRSLRYGTSLIDDLSSAASSARSQRRARLEEQIAKAPVKMLLPVGALMLPAMLILVVGPILLELMNGL